MSVRVSWIVQFPLRYSRFGAEVMVIAEVVAGATMASGWWWWDEGGGGGRGLDICFKHVYEEGEGGIVCGVYMFLLAFLMVRKVFFFYVLLRVIKKGMMSI